METKQVSTDSQNNVAYTVCITIMVIIDHFILEA